MDASRPQVGHPLRTPFLRGLTLLCGWYGVGYCGLRMGFASISGPHRACVFWVLFVGASPLSAFVAGLVVRGANSARPCGPVGSLLLRRNNPPAPSAFRIPGGVRRFHNIDMPSALTLNIPLLGFELHLYSPEAPATVPQVSYFYVLPLDMQWLCAL